MREAVSFYYFHSLFIISLPLCLPLPVNTFVMCEHAAQNTTEFSLRLNLLEFPGRLTGKGSQLVENSPHLTKIHIHCIFTCIFRFEVVSLLCFFLLSLKSCLFFVSLLLCPLPSICSSICLRCRQAAQGAVLCSVSCGSLPWESKCMCMCVSVMVDRLCDGGLAHSPQVGLVYMGVGTLASGADSRTPHNGDERLKS